MNTLPFIKNLFFKRDANNELTINVPITLLVFFVISFGVLLIGDIFALLITGYDIYYPYLLSLLLFGVISVLPVYMLIRCISQDSDSLLEVSDQNRLQYSAILFGALTVIFILISFLSGVFYDNILLNILLPLVIGGISAGLLYFILGKLNNVEPLPNYVTRKNHYLAFIFGYIGAYFTGLLGIITAIYLYTRKDNEYAKIQAIFLIGFSILMWIVTFYLASLQPTYYY